MQCNAIQEVYLITSGVKWIFVNCLDSCIYVIDTVAKGIYVYMIYVYCIVGKFGVGKVWQIICDSSN